MIENSNEEYESQSYNSLIHSPIILFTIQLIFNLGIKLVIIGVKIAMIKLSKSIMNVPSTTHHNNHLLFI